MNCDNWTNIYAAQNVSAGEIFEGERGFIWKSRFFFSQIKCDLNCITLGGVV